MSKIAIDIALFPSEDVAKRAIKINSQLVNNPIKLNKKNCFPHITLCMGIVDEKNLPRIKKIISELGKSFTKLSLVVTGIEEKHSCFVLKKSKDLQRMHEEVMEKMQTFLSYDATVDMCYSPPPVVEKTLFWINGFSNNSSYKNYYPHLTLATKGLEGRKMKVNFTSSKIVICQLGNYCTCRKILHLVSLS